MNSIRQLSTVVEPRRNSTTLPKTEAASKKNHDGLVAVSRSDPLHFLNPDETITADIVTNRRNAPQTATPAPGVSQ